MVKFSRPPNFKYLSGQWVRLSFTAFQPSEYHSLTLTSAPHENYLSVHAKAQGPWTWKLRNFFDPNNMQINEVPKVSINAFLVLQVFIKEEKNLTSYFNVNMFYILTYI